MKGSLIRVGGITAVLGGVYLLLMAGFQAFNRGDVEDYPLIAQTMPLMPILLLLGAVGLFILANGRRGVQVGAGVIALGTLFMAVGFALMTWFSNENGWPIWFWGMVAIPLGFLVFGLANRQAKILSRWNNLLLICGNITIFLLFLSIAMTELFDLLSEQQGELLFAVYLLVLAIGWIFVGIAMVLGERDTADSLTVTAS